MTQRKQKDAPSSRFVGEGAFRVVPLTVPVEFNGKVYEKITVRRMNVREMRAYVQAASEDPNIVPDMLDCPKELLEELFPDDADTVDGAITDFLPRRLKEVVEQHLASGETMSASSPPSSDNASQTSTNSNGTS